jgi:hypothetical protein
MHPLCDDVIKQNEYLQSAEMPIKIESPDSAIWSVP